MRSFGFVAACAGTAVLPTALAWAGMDKVLDELQEKQLGDRPRSYGLIGDLSYLEDHELSPVGGLVKGVLLGQYSGETNDTYYQQLPPLGTQDCAYDTCCVWQHIANEMAFAFRHRESGECNDAARASIHLAFHDAAGWSLDTGSHGGADGSIVWASEELTRISNRGLDRIANQMRIWYDKYSVGYDISMADLIQMAASVATVTCPLGPRIRTFVGRPDSHIPCEDGLLPNPFDTADNLIELFRRKTIEPYGLAALLGAHSASRQFHLDPSRWGFPQDSTPGVWDVLFYKQTLGRAPPDILRFPSDVLLAEDPRIYPAFSAFASHGGQGRWNAGYAREYVRLSLLGVYNINNLTDCSHVLPRAQHGWQADEAITQGIRRLL